MQRLAASRAARSSRHVAHVLHGAGLLPAVLSVFVTGMVEVATYCATNNGRSYMEAGGADGLLLALCPGGGTVSNGVPKARIE